GDERALHAVQSQRLDAADPPGSARGPLAGAARLLVVGRDPEGRLLGDGRARQPGAPGAVPRRADRPTGSEPRGPPNPPLTDDGACSDEAVNLRPIHRRLARLR